MAKTSRGGAPKAEKRCFQTKGRWYWKPERDLRPTWRNEPLGADFVAAMAQARMLNAKVDDWRARMRAGGAAADKGLTGRAPRASDRAAHGSETVSQLVIAYKLSADWKGLRARTQAGYAYEFSRLESEFGDERAAAISPARVDDWLDDLRFRAPATARAVAAKGRLLFQWAGRKGRLPRGVNPFMGARIGQGGKRKARMTADDLAALVAACDDAGRPSLGTALTIAFWCVQRITDVIALRAGNIVGDRLIFNQSKTSHVGARGALTDGFRVDMALPAAVSRRLVTQPPKHGTAAYLAAHDETGDAWHEKTISRVFLRIKRALIASDPERYAHLTDIQLRDGRRSGFVYYHLRGASIPDICSMSGHSLDEGFKIIEHYLPKLPEMADRAVKLGA